MLYFAYGSNMDWSQMRERCPSTRFVCIAELKGHSLAFNRRSTNRNCGVADAIARVGRSVWGVVYEIEEADIRRLDQSEGFRPGRPSISYVREERYVFADGDATRPMTVWVYFASREPNPPRPNAEYKTLIVEGARHWHLPEEYIRELEAIEVGA